MGLLQMTTLSRPLVDELAARHGAAEDAPLDARVDAAVAALRARRGEAARARGPLALLGHRLDGWIRTDRPELLDDPDVPEATKLRLVEALHIFNRVIDAYGRFLRVLQPILDAVRREEGRPARILELASGAGEFALTLAARARRQGVPLEVAGSDVVPAQVARAAAAARDRGLGVPFHLLDATDLGDVAPGSYDVIFIAQSMHHFPPGLLARIIAAGARVARRAFVGVDGRRGLAKLLLVPGPTWLAPWTPEFHDAIITARKFYSEPELELIARIAAPGATVTVGRQGGIYSSLVVEPPRG